LRLNPRSVKKALVVTPSNLGDIVLTFPVFQALLEAFPSVAIDALTTPAGRLAFEGDARIRRVFPYGSGLSARLSLLGAVRRERYDVIIDLRHSLVGFFGGARARNRYVFRPRTDRHRAEGHLAALAGIAPPPKGRFWEPSSESSAVAMLKANAAGPLVVAAAGSKSHLKIWPAAHFARLLDKLAAVDGCRIALVGDASDAPASTAVKQHMNSAVLDLTGTTDLRVLREVISSAALVVTNDSAPLHVADALGVPTLALFGPTDPAKYGPRGTRTASLRKDIFCSPCERPLCRPGGSHECMNELGPDEAYRRAAALLSGTVPIHTPRILVVRLDRVGDLVLSLPAVQAVRRRHPNAWIAMMTRPYTRALVEGHPLVDETIPYLYEKGGRHCGALGSLRMIREIRKRRFDAALILHPSNRSMLVPFFAGVPLRVGFKSGPWWALTRAVADCRHEGSRHEADLTLDVARAYLDDPGVPVEMPEIPVSREEELRAWRKVEGAIYSDERIVALHPGASCPSKRWPLDRFAELGRRIAAETPYRVAIVGGREDAASGHELAAAIGPRAADLTGRFDLKELAAFLRRTEALVSNDSGPVHVAAAVGTPTVAIFGRVRAGLSSSRWAPLGDRNEVVRKDVGCVECLAHRCPIGFECLSTLGVDEVYDALGRVTALEREAAR